MPNPTLAQRLALGLLALGFAEQSSPSRKYRKFTRQTRQSILIYWLGKSGALRTGPNSSTSFAASQRSIAAVLHAAERSSTISTEQL